MDTKDTQFYEMYIQLFENPRYCHAVNVRKRNGDRITKSCIKCGLPYVDNPLDLVIDLERGSLFPDFLDCTWGLIIVSDKVLNDWIRNGIRGYVAYDIQVDKLLSKRLNAMGIPKYHNIKIIGYCEWNRKKTDIDVINQCPVCRNIEFKHKLVMNPRFIFDLPTWNGEDIIRTSIFTYSFCTKKIVECAKANGHTGIEFIDSTETLLSKH